ncbi:MAG: thiolase family protein [Chloroflexi bacterium]|nr:thiolase family protein [Chloroflexota bacterium]
MNEKVGIVAQAQTKYEPLKEGVDLSEMIFDVVKQVREQTGLKFTLDGTGIDSTVTCSQDLWDGRTISGMFASDVAGAHLRPEEKVAGNGVSAAAYGCMQILSGHYDVVLMVAWCRESITNGRLVEWMSMEPFVHRMLGMDFCAAAALQARRYMDKYSVTPEDCARVVVRAHSNARNNPYAQSPRKLSVEDVLKSKELASPIRELDAKPTSDGACAIILAREDKAKKITSNPIWIKGFGSCYDAHMPGDRDLAKCDALVSAARQAYKEAGIKDPAKEISLAEISASYAYQELMYTEGLGLCGEGEAKELLAKGVTDMGGRLPVNPSGGSLVGNPVTVDGAVRVAEAFLQLSNQAGARQVPGARVAVAHGVDGACGQLHNVMVLGI